MRVSDLGIFAVDVSVC